MLYFRDIVAYVNDIIYRASTLDFDAQMDCYGDLSKYNIERTFIFKAFYFFIHMLKSCSLKHQIKLLLMFCGAGKLVIFSNNKK